MTAGLHLELEVAGRHAASRLHGHAGIRAELAHGQVNDEPREHDREQRARRHQHDAVAQCELIVLVGVLEIEIGSGELHGDQLLQVGGAVDQRRTQRLIAPHGEIRHVAALEFLEQLVDLAVRGIEHRRGLVCERLLFRDHVAEEIVVPVIARLVDRLLDLIVRVDRALLLLDDVQRRLE